MIAAYTTLAGYIILFILHFFIVKKMGMGHVYDIRFIVGIFCIVMMVSGVMNMLYGMRGWRYIAAGGYCVSVLYLIYRYKGILKVL